jgi:hypothetical protein
MEQVRDLATNKPAELAGHRLTKFNWNCRHVATLRPRTCAQNDPSLCQVASFVLVGGALKSARDSGEFTGVGLVLGPGVAQSEVPGARVLPAALDVRVVP